MSFFVAALALAVLVGTVRSLWLGIGRARIPQPQPRPANVRLECRPEPGAAPRRRVAA